MKTPSLLAGLAFAALAPSVAVAAPPPPPPPPTIAACSDALVMVGFGGYLDCLGAFSVADPGMSNPNGTWEMEYLKNATWAGNGLDWSFVDKWDVPGSNYSPMDDPADPDSDPDAYLTKLTFDTPLSGMFVVGIKQSTMFSFYMFNAVSPISWIALDSRGTIEWDPSKPEKGQGFSHVTAYTTTSSVPEPATVVLMGTGLLGLGLAARKRRK